MTLSSKLVAQVVADLVDDQDLSSAVDRLTYTQRIALASGTGANQADLLWHDQRTLAAATSEELDLAGSLVDALGNTLTFARVKGIVFAAAAGNGDNIEVGGAAVNAWAGLFGDATDVVLVRPGGLVAAYAPDATAYPVTAGTGDLLQINNADAAAAATYDIVIVGASA